MDRLIRVRFAFDAERPVLTVAALARRTELPLATAYRWVDRLVRAELLQKELDRVGKLLGIAVIAIAVVIAHGDAAPDGTMRGIIEAAQLAGSPTREVILLGRVSGTFTIGHPE